MRETDRLRDLASRCRDVAETLHDARTAETLRGMASEFDRNAAACERLPIMRERMNQKSARSPGKAVDALPVDEEAARGGADSRVSNGKIR